ncbi:MAG: glycoside hydrolase family 97 catalytic domain-containing protein, partial [Candidatus Eremiobacteraeota bacterium]|nr:glycoside hydrolase family 97 catalytic domain-containing protein [Candidatus Eremiobacteraeota bacterium]
TYPNMMTREGVRGMEWNAWSRGNPPEHTVNLAFTRMLAGPLDYTPGIFDLDFSTVGDDYRHWNAIDGLETTGRMHSTLSRQLALFVVLYSPIQMASDLIENYDHPAFAFLREVPVNWDETRVLTGAIGDQVTIARRQGVHWYIGSITDEQARSLSIKLDFLEPGKTYQATVYRDSDQTAKNPEAYQIDQLEVKTGQTLKLELAPAGGQAIAIHPVD